VIRISKGSEGTVVHPLGVTVGLLTYHHHYHPLVVIQLEEELRMKRTEMEPTPPPPPVSKESVDHNEK